MRRAITRLFQIGVQPGERHTAAAVMREWPEQQVPSNFNMPHEHRYRMRPFPRDVGRIPRDFLLQVLYRHQPCEVDQLWDFCMSNAGCVLDSKRHLRLVLKQCRDEGFVAFEKDPLTGVWTAQLTRERFDEVRQAAAAKVERTMHTPTLRGQAAQRTMDSADKFLALPLEQKEQHLVQLRQQLRATAPVLRKYERTEIDYLPYTDLNGKVSFMWWYEARESTDIKQALPGAAAAGGGGASFPPPAAAAASEGAPQLSQPGQSAAAGEGGSR